MKVMTLGELIDLLDDVIWQDGVTRDTPVAVYKHSNDTIHGVDGSFAHPLQLENVDDDVTIAPELRKHTGYVVRLYIND